MEKDAGKEPVAARKPVVWRIISNEVCRDLAEQPPGPVQADQHLNGKGSEAEGDCRRARRDEMDNRLRDAGAKEPKCQWVGHRCS